MIRPQLVLDIGGVLATNLSPLFWQLLTEKAAISEEALYANYKTQMSGSLWTGRISEDMFWAWLEQQTPHLSTEQARAFIHTSLQPLPALEKIQEWSLIADIHILSNHLPSWVEPIVNPIQPYLKSITISSEVGIRKPDPAIFKLLSAYFPPGSTVLFVDDQQKNIRQAASLGWRTLLADEDGRWISCVRSRLEQDSNQENQ